MPDKGLVFGGLRAIRYTSSPVFQGAKAPRQVLVASIDARQALRRLPETQLTKHAQQLILIPAEDH